MMLIFSADDDDRTNEHRRALYQTRRALEACGCKSWQLSDAGLIALSAYSNCLGAPHNVKIRDAARAFERLARAARELQVYR